MGEALPNPARRSAHLTTWLQCLLWTSLSISFLSGMLVWWGERFQDPLAVNPAPAWFSRQFWIVTHGVLNPLLCLLYGYVLCRHVGIGWKLQANRWSGMAMILLWTWLIASGTGLYYAGDEQWRSFWNGTHRGAGLALPIVLLWHWLGARRYAQSK